MTTPTATRRADMRSLRESILGRESVVYTDPEPVVFLPASVTIPKTAKGKALTEAAALVAATTENARAAEDRAADAQDDASDEQAWRKRRDDIAGKIARGEIAPGSAEDALPYYDPGAQRGRFEVALYALKEARKMSREAVAQYDRAVADIAPDLVGSVVAQMHDDARAAEKPD